MKSTNVPQGIDKLYWGCQIAGWGGYSAIGLWVAVLEHGWRRSNSGDVAAVGGVSRDAGVLS
jgi:hypothetical protein